LNVCKLLTLLFPLLEKKMGKGGRGKKGKKKKKSRHRGDTRHGSLFYFFTLYLPQIFLFDTKGERGVREKKGGKGGKREGEREGGGMKET